MCYTVLVVESLCYRGHPTKVTACWRQCYDQAYENFQTLNWSNLCENIESPQTVDEMVQVTYPSPDDEPDMVTPCAACANIEGDPRARELVSQIEHSKTQISTVESSLDQIEEETERAYEQLTGDELRSALQYLSQTEDQNIGLLQYHNHELTEYENEYNQISTDYGSQITTALFEYAYENLNVRPKIYMGRAQEREKQQREDHPRHHRRCETDIYECEIYLC